MGCAVQGELGDIFPFVEYSSLAGRQIAGQQVEESCFAGTVGPNDGMDRIGLNFDADIGYCDQRAKLLAQAFCFYNVVIGFENPLILAFYVLALVMVTFHVYHGLWSAFQTVGANHPKYMPLVVGASIVLSIIFGFGFGYLPIYMTISG